MNASLSILLCPTVLAKNVWRSIPSYGEDQDLCSSLAYATISHHNSMNTNHLIDITLPSSGQIGPLSSTINISDDIIGLLLGLCPANERRRYKVTPSLTGWAQTYRISPGSPAPMELLGKPGNRFGMKMSTHQHRISHYQDKTVLSLWWESLCLLDEISILKTGTRFH